MKYGGLQGQDTRTFSDSRPEIFDKLDGLIRKRTLRFMQARLRVLSNQCRNMGRKQSGTSWSWWPFAARRLSPTRMSLGITEWRNFSDGLAPAPDILHLSGRGFDYEVLQGFGDLLRDVLCIELRTQVYPIYKDQRLLHDVIAYLADFGFVLRTLNPVPTFDGDISELDACFTKNIRVRKPMLLADIWGRKPGIARRRACPY